jgi:VCBS repeat-containing protein
MGRSMRIHSRSWAKNKRQNWSRSLRLALEPRMVFDASVADIVDTQVTAEPLPEADSATDLPIEPQNPPDSLAAAETEAMRLISEFLQQPDAHDRLFTVFNGRQESASQEWLDGAKALAKDIQEGRYSVQIETIGNQQIGGVFGAYSAQGPSGEPTIFINRDWLNSNPSQEAVSRVLIEEIGHSLDHALNGNRDTAGDEGEAFAASVLHSELSEAEYSRLNAEDDRSTIYLDGNAYQVEEASLTFSAIYQGTPSSWSQEAQRIQNVSFITGSNFKFTSADPNAPYFSGNNVAGTLTYKDGSGATQSVDGVISRLFKTGSRVEGLFFYAYGNTSTIGDGATDSAETSYILCIDPSKFTDGYSYYTTSSDPVDTKMNEQIVPNSAPVAGNDTATVTEDSSVTSNVLSNDTDANADSLTVSAFSISGQAGPFVVGTPYTISGVGSLTINSNGGYTFTPVANYAGSVPLVTYTVSDGTVTATATLSISITPVNDAPTSSNDSVTTNQNTAITLKLTDFGSYSDIENSPLAKIKITTLETQGALQYYNGASWVDVPLDHEIAAADINAGKLRYTPATGESGAAYTTIGFKVSDGSSYSASAYTLTVNVNAGNTAPVANADTSPDAVESGYNISGTNPTGNVLSNDSDADTAITAGTTHKVTSAGNTDAHSSESVASGTTSISSPASVGGLYGTLKIGADGSYIYEVDNSNSTVQALRTTANTLTEIFTYIMADASGATATSTLTVTIKGSNDAPVAEDDRDTLQETALSGGYYGTASGNVITPNDTDVDSGDSISLSGSYATATGSSNGSVTVTFTGNGLASVSTGDYVYIDGATPQLLTVNGTAVTATKTASGITLSNQSALTQNDQNVTLASGSVLGFSRNNPPSGGYKTATINATEAPSSTAINVGNITNVISKGMTVTDGTDTRTVQGLTYTNGVVTQITLNSAAAWSNASLTFSASASTVLTGEYGTLTFGSDGSYTYNLTSNALNQGQSYTEQFSYRITDSGSATDDAVLYVTVNGTTSITLADDSVTVSEDSGSYSSGASNLLTNDTGATSITGFSWNGQTATAGNSITVADVGVLTVNSDGTFTFDPVDNYTGTVPTVIYTATNGTYTASALLTITISAVNDAPTATNDAVTTLEDTTVVLALSDFGTYSDIENNSLSKIKITTLETSGSLEYDNNGTWEAVTLNQEITAADIGANKLRFVPSTNDNGSPYTTIGFKVSDGTDYSANAYTLTVNVTPVNDAPVNTVPGAQTLYDYQTLTFSSGLSVADVDDNSLTVELSVANGALAATLDNQNGSGAKSGAGTSSSPLVLTGTKAEINAMLATLVYTPDSNFSGSDTLRMVTTDAGGLTDIDYVSITVDTDNRALTVSSPTVNEASPYAVFTVGGASGQKVILTLTTTGTGDGYAVSGSDFLAALEYFDGNNWVSYSGTPVAIPAGGTTMLVRTPILQDTTYEGSETFKLIATNTAGVSNASGGIATIRDDGQGDIYPDNTTGATDNSTTKDDDRPLSVSNITVNEASSYAVFEVSGVAGQKVTSLTLVNATADNSDHGTTLQYYDASANGGAGAWTTYTNGDTVTLDGTGKLLVRTTITNDNPAVYEGAETFTLVATNTGNISASGTAAILDDGTGDIYLDNTTGSKESNPSNLDRDSAVSVTAYGPVNEGSTYAMFTVNSSAGVDLELSLNNYTTALNLSAETIEYSYDGTNWTTYTWNGSSGNKPTAPDGTGGTTAGKVYVRVTIASETDTVYEGSEMFELIATTIATGSTLTQSASAFSTIIDNGTGTLYDGTISSGSPTGSTSNLDDDTPTLTVSSPSVAESGGYAVFTVSLDHASTSAVSFTPSLSSGTATLGTDTAASNTLEVSTDGGTNWSTVSGSVTIAAGQTSVKLRLAVTDDASTESSENFTLSTGAITGTLTSNTTVTGTATITDNDSVSDTTPPTIAISSDKSSLKAGETATITFTLSESASDFVEGDIAVSGGTLSNFTGSGTSYSATFTPTASSTTDGVISVASTKFTDAAGNANNDGADANNSVTMTVDTARPTIAISSDKSSLKAGETATITFTLSESASDFVEGDIAVSGGTLSNFTGSGTSYSATFTPTASSTTDGVISVASTKFTDAANNANNDGADANNSVTMTVDTARPTATITLADTALKAGETSLVTITFSEAVTGFTNADLTIANGTLTNVSSADSGVTWTATFTPTADLEDTSNVITLTNTGVTDAAGNTGTGTTDSANYTIDTLRPTIAISSDKSSLKAGETATITFTLSESASDFVEGDIAVSGGTLSNFTGSGTSYSATFTPTASSTTDGVISVASTKFTDAAGNANNDGADANNSVTMTVDTARPTATITLADTALKAGETSLVTITFSEAVTGFTNADLTIANGTLTNVSSADSGVTWTATFTPTADLEDTSNVITLTNTGVTDAAGNTGTGTTDSGNYTIDTLRPTIAISSDKSSLKAGETATITFTLSESASDFVEGDIAVSGGTLSNFTGSGTSYSATFTPTASSTTDGVISVANTKFTDAAGNANNDGADANNSVTMTVDTARPTIAISSDKSSLKAGETATITFTLSESASDFVEGDIAVSGGTLSNFTGSGTSYSATFTPTASSTTDGVISVASSKFTDAAGNANNDGADANNSVTMTVDTARPTATITLADTALKAGETSLVTITFSEAVTGFSNADLTIANGTLTNVSSADSGVTWTATFTPTADLEDTTNVITLANTGVTDSAGNAGTGTTDSGNYTIDTLRPTIAISSNKSALRVGETATVTFALSESASDFVEGDIAVSGGTLSNFTGSGTSYTATFTQTASDSNGTVSVASNKFTDEAGNANNDGADANNSLTLAALAPVDSTRPTIAVSSNKSSLKTGETATITFTLSESASDFVVGDIAVSGGSLSNFTGSGASYSATFTPTASSTANGVISVASNKFSDAAGNANNDGADANNSVTMTVDTARPTATITLSDIALKAGDTSLVTFTFSETVTGFTNADLTVANGTLTNVAPISGLNARPALRQPGILTDVSSNNGGRIWTATFTPSADIEDATNVIMLDNTGVTDTAGNAGVGTTYSANYAIDTLRPTIEVSSNKSVLEFGETASIAFTLSEPAGDFSLRDISVSGGSLSNFTGSGINYTAIFTPAANSIADGVIIVASDRFTDPADNANIDGADADNTVTMTLNTLPETRDTLPDAPPGSIVLLANSAPSSTPDTANAPSQNSGNGQNQDNGNTVAPASDSGGNPSALFTGATGTDNANSGDSSPRLFNSQGDSMRYELSLTGTIKNQMILENKEFTFRIPNGVFTHTNTSEVLDFKATSPSGGALPPWVHFDPNTKTFSGIPPVGAKSVTVLVTVRDTNGKEVRTTFTMGVNKEDNSQAGINRDSSHSAGLNKPLARVANGFKTVSGKPGLSVQVNAAGKMSRLQESRALLDSLKQL